MPTNRNVSGEGPAPAAVTELRRPSPDVVVIGDGVIGLAVALAVARAGGTSRLIGRPDRGAASPASAGLLAPSIGPAEPHVRAVMEIARDRYPDFTYWLAERTGIDVPVNRDGIIEIIDSPHALGPDSSSSATATPLDAEEVRSLEPGLATGFGGLLHPLDGFVDNVRLLEAMRECARCEWAIDVIHARASRIVYGSQGCVIHTEDGQQHVAGAVVVAAGAWSPLVDGLPRALHVEPVRGQMVRLHGAPLRHAVSAPDGYLVPRGDTTLVGSTLERVGFDSTTTPTSLARLRAAAVALCPALGDGAVVDAWAGLRPMTPDGLPLIGQDPEVPWLVYACGHGKNGILLAALTGECVAALVAGSAPPVDLAPFSVNRFD